MATFKTNQRVVDDVREVKQVRKVLPYTVTPIGGAAELVKWKADQITKQLKWEDGRAARYKDARDRAIAVLNGKASPTESVHTKQAAQARAAFEGYNRSAKTSAKNDTRIEIVKQESLFTRLSNRLLNWFLSINLN